MCLLQSINRCLARTGLSASQFGRRAVNDPRLVRDLRRGREPRPRMIARVTAYIAELEAR